MGILGRQEKPRSNLQPEQVPPRNPKEMHPVAAEAMSRFAQVYDDNERLRRDNHELVKENEVLRGVDKEKGDLIAALQAQNVDVINRCDARVLGLENHFRQQLIVAEHAKEKYLRYAVALAERINSCVADLQVALETATEMAKVEPKDVAIKDIDRLVKEVEDAVAERPTPVDQLQIPESAPPRGNL